MSGDGHAGHPIFILGIMPRSGTNFLKDLLMLHPHCVRPSEPIWEAYLVHHSDLLKEYIDLVFRRWHHGWNVSPKERDALREHIARGILNYFGRLHEPGSRLVLKTPSVRCLPNQRLFFPDCPLLILVRDGRSVVESGVRTFDWDFEWAVRSWRDAAQTVLRFHERHRNSGGYRIVRYEDLHADPRREMKKIQDFLGLPQGEYDMAAAERLPVRGSSQLQEEGTDPVHWTPVERPADFAPIERWRDWDLRLHSRFNWLAGREMQTLDYLLEPGTPHMGGPARNRYLDFRWKLAARRSLAARIVRALGRRIRRAAPFPSRSSTS